LCIKGDLIVHTGDTIKTNGTVIDSILLSSKSNSWFLKLALIVGGSLLLTISAKIQVPFYPVPMTMQTFVVLSVSMLFGWRLGALTVVLYLAEGALGLPVFAGTPEKGIGLSYILGPTGGYLLGFLLSSIVVGFMAENGFDRTVGKTILTMFIGTSVIYLFGYVWLATLIGFEKSFIFGVQPFLLSAVFKILLAAAVFPLTWRVIKRFY
jgi:biotin transport system substrate-specific component